MKNNLFIKKGFLPLTGVLVVILCIGLILHRNNPTDAEKLQELLELGTRYLEEMNYEEAVLAFENAIEIEPYCLEAYLGMSSAFEALGQSDRAIEAMETAREMFPQEETVYIQLAELYHVQGAMQEYVEILEEGYESTRSEKLKRVLGEYNEETEDEVKTPEEDEETEYSQEYTVPENDERVKKDEPKLGRELNAFLSEVYRYGVRKYDFRNYDMYYLLLGIGYGLDGRIGDYDGGYRVVDYEDVRDVSYRYFRITELPKENIKDKSSVNFDILYQDNRYYFPVENTEIGVPLVIASDVRLEEEKYEVIFDVVYILFENFDTGESNPIEDFDVYYDYDMAQIEEDMFVEKYGYGKAIMDVDDDGMFLLEFLSYFIQNEDYSKSLTEEDAYKMVEKYWISINGYMPQNVEYEGIVEKGHCFWGYYMAEDHAATNFRIAVDPDTGLMYDLIRETYIN